MAIVPSFQHDVFLSYAHVDNVPLPPNEEGWVTRFHGHLKTLLAKRCGRAEKVSIWRDVKLQGNDYFNDNLVEVLRSSAIFVCIMSTGYQKSKSCQKELEAFCANDHGPFKLRVGMRSRVFRVGLSAIPEEEEAMELQSLLGYRFYDSEPRPGWSREVRPTRSDDPDQRYWIRLDELADQIADLLKDMARQAHPLDPDRPLEKSPGALLPASQTTPVATVYLAEVTEDLDDDRRLLQTDLEQHGVQVLPEAILPNKRSELEPLVLNALGTSQFSIHMLAQRYGRPLVDGPRSLGHIQYDLAAQVARQEGGKLRRIVWIPPDLKNKISQLRPEQQKLIEIIRNETDKGVPPEVLDNYSLEALKHYILDAIKRFKEPSPSASPGALIFIAGHKDDFSDPDAVAMIQCLTQRHDVVKSALRDQKEDRELHEIANIKYCDGLMILYGKPEHKDWVETKAIQAKELTRSRHKKPLALAVYDGPPPEKEQLEIILKDVVVVACRKGFQPAELGLFLNRIEASPVPLS